MMAPECGCEEAGVASWRQGVLAALALVRLAAALLPGYIHPDEHFQAGEVAAGDVLGVDHMRPWEFDPAAPTRSCAAPFAAAGVALATLRALARWTGLRLVTPQAVVYGPRLALAVASLGVDAAAGRAARAIGRASCGHPAEHEWRASIVLATSWPILVLQVRTFSNSLESIALGAVLYAAASQALPPPRQGPRPGLAATAAAVAATCALGGFLRFTFAAFAAPLALYTVAEGAGLLGAGERGPPRGAWAAAARATIAAAAAGLATALVLCAADSAYYGRLDAGGGGWGLVVTPLNGLRYNLQAANLAKHGLHPRALHVAVNMPLLFGPLGPLALASAWRAVARPGPSGGPGARLEAAVAWSTALPLAALSMAPHQEPRFLLPLAAPVAVLASHHVAGPSRMAGWVAFNAALGVFFGGLHQGGVLPAIFRAHELTLGYGGGGGGELVAWRTYMPPRYPLLQPAGGGGAGGRPGGLAVTDLAGGEARLLGPAFDAAAARARSGGSGGLLLLLAPAPAVREARAALPGWEFALLSRHLHVGTEELGRVAGDAVGAARAAGAGGYGAMAAAGAAFLARAPFLELHSLRPPGPAPPAVPEAQEDGASS